MTTRCPRVVLPLAALALAIALTGLLLGELAGYGGPALYPHHWPQPERGVGVGASPSRKGDSSRKRPASRKGSVMAE